MLFSVIPEPCDPYGVHACLHMQTASMAAGLACLACLQYNIGSGWRPLTISNPSDHPMILAALRLYPAIPPSASRIGLTIPQHNAGLAFQTIIYVSSVARFANK